MVYRPVHNNNNNNNNQESGLLIRSQLYSVGTFGEMEFST